MDGYPRAGGSGEPPFVSVHWPCPPDPGARAPGDRQEPADERENLTKKKQGQDPSPAEPTHEATVTEHSDGSRHGPLLRLLFPGEV